MCGRYILNRKIDEVAEFFGSTAPASEVHPAPRFNIAPTQLAPVVRQRESTTVIECLRWGLVPSWAPNTKRASRLINARSESVLHTRSFREAMKTRRCLVPATGFYEWRRGDPERVPHWIRPRRAELFAFAGVWSSWRDPSGDQHVESFAILTTAAEGALGELHHRFPVVVPESRCREWLDSAVSPTAFRALYAAPPSSSIVVSMVDPQLNAVRFEGSRCLSSYRRRQPSLL